MDRETSTSTAVCDQASGDPQDVHEATLNRSRQQVENALHEQKKGNNRLGDGDPAAEADDSNLEPISRCLARESGQSRSLETSREEMDMIWEGGGVYWDLD